MKTTTETTADRVAANIRAEMGRQRVSVVELARRTGLSRPTVHRQVNDTGLTFDTLDRIARALDVDPAALLVVP
ncbi:helix-turn-helix domain-containing protein [Mycobacteroides abscessus]|uniref:helix-turn-helix domain-containing protein n=1 Tax=Mycobacteroides abscessus TaxID=36809 RepID=UPI0006970A50|nr:helix-turn-helix transcriptional regulator [Mycobacteroides abscessus]